MASTQVALSPKPPHLEAGPSSLRRVRFHGPNNPKHDAPDDEVILSTEKDKKTSFASPKKMKEAASIHKGPGRKRSYSLTESKSPFKRRRKEDFVRPTKFLLGGNCRDPLNLGSLADETINRALNEKTPQSSPLPTPRYRKEQIEVLIPPNICDPLNLNVVEDDNALIFPDAKKRKRPRHKRRRRTRSASEVLHRTDSKDLLLEAEVQEMQITTKPLEEHPAPESIPKTPKTEPEKSEKFEKPVAKPLKVELLKNVKKSEDKIVSPVVPQPGARKRMFQRSTSRDPHIKQPQTNVPAKLTGPGGKKNQRFMYGNYNRYYGYRNPEREEDIRLRSFKPEWFRNKSVLDIGCNIGHVTLSIGRDFGPRRVIGMDIDPNLITVARKNIRHYANTQPNPGTTFPICMSHFYGPLTLGEIPDAHFPRNVEFIHGNYVLASDDLLQLERPDFDVIICLSVTKWVHLNWGDAGLKRFFRRMFLQLNPGGKLILEAQGWSSYSKRKKLTETIAKNYASIQLYPEKFKDYLLQQVGFQSCEVIAIPGHSAQGFRRPILLFTKAPGPEPEPPVAAAAALVISATTTSTTITTMEFTSPEVSISETVTTQQTTVMEMEVGSSVSDTDKPQDDPNKPPKDSG